MSYSNYHIQPFESLPLRHRFMFGQVMQEPKICQMFLEELFGWEIERIDYVEREKDLDDGYFSHGVRLDIYFRNSNAVYNVEMQSDRNDALERRIRYYQSGIDREELRRGRPYEDLSESYIIFICNYDPLGEGNALYERCSFWKDTHVEYDDGAHAVLLNSHYRKRNASPAILELLDYIRTNNDAADYSSTLAKQTKAQVHDIRLDRKIRRRYMWIELEMRKRRAEGEAIGREKSLIERVCKKLIKGKAVETIADELEEELAVIEKICEAAKPFSPEYDAEKVFEAMSE